MSDIGIIGIGTMGSNLALNILRHGFRVSVYDQSREAIELFKSKVVDKKQVGSFSNIEEFITSLEKPRRIWLMVNAGHSVENVLSSLQQMLDKGDILIDGGNSHYMDTERRAEDSAKKGYSYLGVGVSGGAEGALYGPSLMIGGDENAYKIMAPIFNAISAKAADGFPCEAYLGWGGAGHFVKMVHNGIEYALMQSIAEIYDIFQRIAGMPAEDIADHFFRWNEQMLSFLLSVTEKVLKTMDEETGRPLVDLILDSAEQKGTGTWTSVEALKLGVSIPVITSAVDARLVSACREERLRAAQLLPGPSGMRVADEQLSNTLFSALVSTWIIAYNQGFLLLKNAASAYGYSYEPGTVAKIWEAGCIIRSAYLENISEAFFFDNGLENFMVADIFRNLLETHQEGWRKTVVMALQNGIPTPALSASLAFYDAYRSARLPSNLIQAQRDYFGGHRYARIDRPGKFHTEWQRI